MSSEQTKAVISSLVIVAVNVANIFGYALDANLATNIGLTIAAIVTLVYGIWKNHNFTQSAVLAQEYLDSLKSIEDEDEETPYN